MLSNETYSTVMAALRIVASNNPLDGRWNSALREVQKIQEQSFEAELAADGINQECI